MLLKLKLKVDAARIPSWLSREIGKKKVYSNYLADPGASSNPVQPTCKWHNEVTFNEHMKGPD